MLNVLKEAAHIQPLLLKEQLDIVRHKHRVTRYFKKLMTVTVQFCLVVDVVFID